jgi:N-acetylglucosamine-6-phosphate deacetylase
MSVLANARVVTPDGVLEPGYVAIRDATITAVGAGAAPPHDDAVDLGGRWLLPGFIDLHMHGGSGADVARSPDDIAAAAAFHRTHGTTRTLISLVTAPPETLVRQLAWVADLADEPAARVVGAHLEGPFLSRVRCGAQNPAHLRAPDRGLLARLITAGHGSVRTMTLAPELPGALELIADLKAAGVVAALGHSDAGWAEAGAAIAAGATLATHLFNGMRPLHHREPGIIGAALGARLACEVINDGVHVHPSIPALVERATSNLVLVTDAIEAAGRGDGEYELGGQRVLVHDGQARLADSGSLAGSTLTMDDAVRRAVRDGGLTIEQAAAAAAGNPARVLGLDDRCGRIAPGLDADLVVLDDELRVDRVMVGGAWVQPATTARSSAATSVIAARAGAR